MPRLPGHKSTMFVISVNVFLHSMHSISSVCAKTGTGWLVKTKRGTAALLHRPS
jgi:hypothetical protein